MRLAVLNNKITIKLIQGVSEIGAYNHKGNRGCKDK